MAKNSGKRYHSNSPGLPPRDKAEGVVLLDSGEPAKLPNPNDYHLGIGRLVAGSSVIVHSLKDDLRPDNVIEAFGQFVYPYVSPLELAGAPKNGKAVRVAINKLHSIQARPVEVTLAPAVTMPQDFGNVFAVMFGIQEGLRDIRGEIARTRQSATHNASVVLATPATPRFLEVYRTANEQEAMYAMGLVNGFGLTHATFTAPVMYGVPKADSAS